MKKGLLLLFLSFPAFSQTITEPCGPCKRLFMSVLATNVKVTTHNKPEVVLKFSKPTDKNGSEVGEILSQMVLQGRLVKDVFEVRTKISPSKSDWQKVADAPNLPLGRLEVLAPAGMSLELYVNQGDVSVQGWKAGVTVESQKGSVVVSDVAADVVVHSMNGPVKVENIIGAVTVDSFSGKVNVEKVTGKTKVKSFYGDALVKNVRGSMLFTSQLSNFTSKDTNGAMEVQAGSSPMKIQSHKGLLRGQSDAATIDAQILSDAQVRLKSTSGALIASVPKDTPAQVYLASAKGDVRVPKTLESGRDTSSRSVKGALGGGGEGVIRMVSESGLVNLKVN